LPEMTVLVRGGGACRVVGLGEVGGGRGKN
jgi:hypothetical protein